MNATQPRTQALTAKLNSTCAKRMRVTASHVTELTFRDNHVYKILIAYEIFNVTITGCHIFDFPVDLCTGHGYSNNCFLGYIQGVMDYGVCLCV